MTAKIGRVLRVAMELRQIECEDICVGYRYPLTARESWDVIADFLRDEYLLQARRILRVASHAPEEPDRG